MNAADSGFVLPPSRKGDGLQKVAAAAAISTAAAAIAEAAAAPTTVACDVCPAASLRQKQDTIAVSSVLTSGRTERYKTAGPPAAAAAAASPSATEAALHTTAATSTSTRPQRPRRPPRKFEVENADPDISYKKALEKSRLETRRVEVDYASLPSIPEIKIASSEEFLVNPVAFYERLERYGREFGGVKIIPPEGWRPPFCLRDLLNDALEFNVREQDIHRLMQGAKFRHPVTPQRASGLQEKDRQMKRQQFGTEKPLLQQIEALYWQSVETSIPELTVHYAADLKTNEVGSGFPTQRKERRQVPQEREAGAHPSADWSLHAGAGGCCRPTLASTEGSCAARETQDISKRVEADNEKQGIEGGASTASGAVAEGGAGEKPTGRREGETEEGTPGSTAAVVASGQAKMEPERKSVRRDVEAQDACGVAGTKNDSKNVGVDTGTEDSTVSDAAYMDVDEEEWKKKGDVSKERQGGQDDVAPPAAAAGVELDSEEQQKEKALFYAWHPWNLTRFARQRGSLLSSFHKDVAGVTSPWLYVGMIFSTFCWHAEDNYFAACNYHHWGDAKLWYVIPPSRAASVERMLQRYLNTKDSDYVLHSLTVQLPPSLFIQHRVPVYRVEQKANEFIMLWPRTYHAGFNAGFNCNEACNFAPASWLPWGHRSIYSYRFMRSTCIPFHQLLLRAACSAEGLAASQLLHMCQALLRLIHEEYALRRTAKEEHVATGLMFLDNSHISQLDVLMPDAECVGSELLSCRRALQYIVGRPLLPDGVSASRTAASNKPAGCCLSHVPARTDKAAAHVPSASTNASAEEAIDAATQTRSFLEVVSGVASLPVKDCDNCRSCCAVSCITCPHIIEHTCLECVGQQTCSCKLQMALIRFALPTLWVVFDHVRSLFLSVCKEEEDAVAQRQSSCAGSAGSSNTCKKKRECFGNAPTGIEICGNCTESTREEGRKTRSNVLDAAEHTRFDEKNTCRTGSENDRRSGSDCSPSSIVEAEADCKRRKLQSHREEGDRALGEDVCADGVGEISQIEEKFDAALREGCEHYVETVQPVPSEHSGVEEAFSLTAEPGGVKFAALVSQQQRMTEMDTSRSTNQQERRKPQQKRGHRSSCRRSRERMRGDSGDGRSRNKRREDELLQDPLYIGLPSLEELVHFEEAAQLLESFSREYCRPVRGVEDATPTQNTAVAAREREKAENGGRRCGKQDGSSNAAKQARCVTESQIARCTSKNEGNSEETPNEKDEVDPLDSSAPSSVTFEERRGSLYMRGENWSLEAVVSFSEAEALEVVKGEEREDSISDETPEKAAGAQYDRLALSKRRGGSISSPTSPECSPLKSLCDTCGAQSPDDRSLQSMSSLRNRHAVECRSRCRRVPPEHVEGYGQEERNKTCKKRGVGQTKEKKLPGAEAVRTLVRQLTWRYFLSALKDEEEDNDERILPVFRKA